VAPHGNDGLHSPLVGKSVGSVMVGILGGAAAKLGPPFRFQGARLVDAARRIPALGTTPLAVCSVQHGQRSRYASPA